MKKYLLLFLMCVYASIGAWANVSYPYNFGTNSSVDYNSTTGVMTVNIATTGDFQSFVSNLAYNGDGTFNLNKTSKLRIVCTNSATISSTEVTNLKAAKSNNAFTSLDLTDAVFDSDATITSLMANGVGYVALPKGKSISDVTLPDNFTTLYGVVTSNGSSATYTAYNGASGQSDFTNNIFKDSSLSNVGTWTIVNGSATGTNIKVGAETSAVLSSILSNSTAANLSITCEGLSQDATLTLYPSSSITNLTLSGIKYVVDASWQTVTVSGTNATSLTNLTIDDTVLPSTLSVSNFPELTTADLRDVRKKGDGALAVTFTDDPKLSSVTLYKSSSDASYNRSGTTPESGVTVTWATPAIPIEYDDCQVTFNLAARGSNTMAQLLAAAQAHNNDNDDTTADICTIVITGQMTAADLAALNGSDAAGVTRIDMSEATLASGVNINSLAIPTTLTSLVLPEAQTVDATLAATLEGATNLKYAYSPTSDTQTKDEQFVADYVWVVHSGGLAQAVTNETTLKSAIYVKVESKSTVALNTDDADLTNKGILDPNPADGNHGWQYVDLSGTMLTAETALAFKAPHYKPYRIILPNDVVTNEHLAMFASNPNVGSIAAVYTYNTTTTTLKIMEIVDASYSPAALCDPRIMKSNTTDVDIVSGYYNGTTYAQFGPNLLAALNNMGNSSYEYVTGKTNTAGLNVRTICVETTSAAPNALTFSNPVITTLNIKSLIQNNAELKFGQCSALTTLDLSNSTLKSVSNKTIVNETTYTCTSISSADFTAAAVTTTTDFSGATALATFTTTDETIFSGNVDLTSSALTSLTSTARFGGDLKLNNSDGLTSVDLSGATFTNSSSIIHVDADESEGETVITTLQSENAIKVPSSFQDNVETRVHPYNPTYVQVASAVVDAVKYDKSDMVFHESTNTGGYYPAYRYWYQGTETDNQIVTIGTSETRTIHDVIAGNANITPTVEAHADLTDNIHVKIKVVGPLTANSIDSLKYLNCTMLDISDATIADGLLRSRILAGNILHANTKFLVLPDTCSRERVINADTLANLSNVYCVIAVQNTEEGRDLTSWSRVAGALQPAVVGALNNDAQSWSLTASGQSRNIYTSSVSNFKKLKISGLINSYDLSKGGQKLDSLGHLVWLENVVETTSQTRTQNGAYTVYGPFSACFLLTEIDLKNAYFEPLPNQTGLGEESVYYRFYCGDMTLSALDLISTATYKVVIPQDSRVREVPADFMNCSTKIRAICIPSNIQAIRARAFWTIDYVWTTSDAFASGSTTADPEGSNTRLDNGAKLSIDGGTTFIPVNALKYENGAYTENPDFLDSYYTADYSTVNGGGTYTFGSTLKLIETGAFANTQPNVTDVYVLNTTAPECHVDAFNTVMYTGNGGYNSAAVSSEGIITREAYYNGRWITMLHYPRQTTDPNIQRYTDPTREYSIATGERDGKGAILYYPNQSEFIRAYQQGTYGYTWNAWDPTRGNGAVDNGTLTNTTEGWSAANQATANGLYTSNATVAADKKKFYSFYDTSLGSNTKPEGLVDYYKVNWNPSTYTYSEVDRNDGTGGNLYPRSEIVVGSDVDGSGEQTEKDYRGWHQFVLTAYAANTVLEEEPYRSYITDNEWWTICPEFDITRSEAALLFGKLPGVQVSSGSPAEYPRIHKLRYVRREYSGETIYLSFTKDLATYREERANETANRKGVFTRTDGETGEITAYTNADQHGTADSYGVVSLNANEPAGDDVVMSAGVPYLIKPNLPANGQRQYRIFKSTLDANNYNNNKAANDPIGYGSETLWAKIKFAQEMGGEAQKLMVKNGTYTVPVFVSVADGTNVVKEEVEKDNGTPKKFRPDDDVTSAVDYYKSADRHYTFVGTLYKSFLPHYCYFLGWDSANKCAKFYYHNGNFETIDNEMRWANGTGVIVPVLATDLTDGKFKYTVSKAESTAKPAQWDLKTTFADDSFVHTGGSTAKQYVMDFNSPDMVAVDDGEVTGIENVNENINENLNGNNTGVYTVNGQYVGTSLKGLAKGVYIVNGKKFIVK